MKQSFPEWAVQYNRRCRFFHNYITALRFFTALPISPILASLSKKQPEKWESIAWKKAAPAPTTDQETIR